MEIEKPTVEKFAKELFDRNRCCIIYLPQPHGGTLPTIMLTDRVMQIKRAKVNFKPNQKQLEEIIRLNFDLQIWRGPQRSSP